METLKGIFPQTQPPPKRDFLRENVQRIRNLQRMRKPIRESEHKFNKQIKPAKKFSLGENDQASHRSSMHSLALRSCKAPINLRKSVNSISTQTSDPSDVFFLKDSIIRYPSASTSRSMSSINPSTGQQTQTCSRGHQMEPQAIEQARPRFKSHFHNRKDEHCDKIERHISNLSEYLDRGSISKKQPPSILKNSLSTASSQKSNKDHINESQRKEDRGQKLDDDLKLGAIEISDDDEDLQKDKRSPTEKELEAEEIKKRQLKAAEDDPDCPEGHVPMPDYERLEALKLAKKRNLKKFKFLQIITIILSLLGFKELVDELNRLPMTCETLRVKNRKIQIEKELREIEITTRVFSRTKVYVKLD